MTRILSLGAHKSFLRLLFSRRAAATGDIREIKRKLRVQLADMPRYLKDDIGLYDD